MSTRKNSFNQIGYGSAAIPRMPTALKEAAIEHEQNRQRVVASILLELQLMALKGMIKDKQLLKLSKAVSQSLKGNREESTQAAHCVPRQVRFGVETMQQVLFRSFPERAWAVSVMFGETDVLPANFNKCDSLAEQKGLEEAFHKACQYAIDVDGEAGREIKSYAVLTRAENAYSIYKAIASTTYRECERFVRNKFKPFLFPPQVKELTEQVQIIEQYSDTLRNSPGRIQGISIPKIEGLIKIYSFL